jgi:hypothetical protein
MIRTDSAALWPATLGSGASRCRHDEIVYVDVGQADVGRTDVDMPIWTCRHETGGRRHVPRGTPPQLARQRVHPRVADRRVDAVIAQVIKRLNQAAGVRGQVGDGFGERVRRVMFRPGQPPRDRARRGQPLLGRAAGHPRRGAVPGGSSLRGAMPGAGMPFAGGYPFRPPAEIRSCRPDSVPGDRACRRRAVGITSGGWCGADEAGDGGVAAQLVQAAAAVGPDAADRDAQPGADLRVGQRGVGDE